jgi:CelD/BcsL family acetyltransferase involved in cellulose biosynthesis
VLTATSAVNQIIRPHAAGTEPLPASTPFRRHRRRTWRRAHRVVERLECREISWEFDHHLPAIAEMQRLRWNGASAYAYGDARYRAMVCELVHRLDPAYRTHVFGCLVESSLAAYVIAFRAGDAVTLWNACADPAFRGLSAGMLLWDHVLTTMARWDGIRSIKFMSGTERYKSDWSDAQYAVNELAVVAAGGAKGRRARRIYERGIAARARDAAVPAEA